MKTNKDIRHENLLILIKEEGSIQAVADKTGKSHAQISQLKNKAPYQGTGNPRGVGDSLAREIEAAFSKPVGWMDVLHEASNVSPAPTDTRIIPVISYVQAGSWREAADAYLEGGGFDYITTERELSQRAFALEIEGDSMLPEFRPGDRVIIDPEIYPSAGDFVAAKNGKNEATFKKYRVRGVGENGEMVFELVPLNEDYETMRSDREPIEIIGKMVEHRKFYGKR